MPASFAASEVAGLFGGPLGNAPAEFGAVSTDTRSLQPGSLFVALRGENHDGTRFLEDARAKGATAAVVPSDATLPELPQAFALYSVPDTRHALGDLAALHRRRTAARVVGITGSSGKTTVKEMVARALGETHTVYATEGNLNNQVGVPLTILAAPDDANVWVLELGSNAPGEIRRLTEVSAPDDAVITTVGAAHLEGFGDIDGVLDEKLDLVRGASADGSVVVGEVPDILPGAARTLRSDAIVAGLSDGADYRPDTYEVGARSVRFERGGVRFEVPVGGEHHLRDLLLAAAIAEQVGVAPQDAARGLAAYEPYGMRSALLDLDGLTVVADCYNANPESFRAAIDYCASSFPGRRRVAVVGSMLELGTETGAAHEEIAARLVDSGFSVIVATGAFRSPLTDGERFSGRSEIVTAADASEATRLLLPLLHGGEVVLIKGSRGARLEGVVEGLQAARGKVDA